MSHVNFTRRFGGVFAILAGLTTACHGAAGPSPTALSLSSIFPTTGPLAGATRVTISGAGFEVGVSVTFNGVAGNVSVLNSRNITVTTPTHAGGAVDVVVTNPGGASATFAGGYTYADPPPPPPLPPPSIRLILPNRVSTTGGAFVEIDGSGFRTGVTVTIDALPITAFSSPGGIFINTMPGHPVGVVDVVVTNPDGQTARVSGGFTYATPESFDLNGDWDGYPPNSDDPTFRFTIQNNVVTSLTCGTSAPIVLSPPTALVNGAFSFADAGGTSFSGHILADSQMIGAVNAPGCGTITWFADRHQ